MLDRFILFAFNLTSLLWSSEHNLIHTDRSLVYFRRGLNIVTLFLGLFAIGIADVIYLNWGCYAAHTNIEDYSKGLCWNLTSSIAQGKTVIEEIKSYRGVDRWIWISNALFAGALFLSLSIHAYLSYKFVDRVRYGMEGSYTGVVDAVDSHGHLITDAENVKKYTWRIFNQHRDKHMDGSIDVRAFTPHDINLHRMGHLFFDPFAMLFGFPHIVLSRSDLAILNFFNIITMGLTWTLYTGWAIPRYDRTCCHYDISTRSGHAGACNDPSARIYHDPFRLKCDFYSYELQIILFFGIAQIILMFLLWLYSTVLFHYIVYKSTRKTIMSLQQSANAVRSETDRHTKAVPPPAYAMKPAP